MRIYYISSYGYQALGRFLRRAFSILVGIGIFFFVATFVYSVIISIMTSNFFKIIIMVLTLIGLITTIVFVYRGARAAINWVVDKFQNIKYSFGRR